jgi:hypothetical protein
MDRLGALGVSSCPSVRVCACDTSRRLLDGTLAALLPLLIVLSRDFGVTWDELRRQRFGEALLETLRRGTTFPIFSERLGCASPVTVNVASSLSPFSCVCCGQQHLTPSRIPVAPGLRSAISPIRMSEAPQHCCRQAACSSRADSAFRTTRRNSSRCTTLQPDGGRLRSR